MPRRFRVCSLTLTIALVLTLTAVAAWAQESGGSFGGGDFGGGGGGGGGGGSDWGGGGGGGGGSDWGSGGGGSDWGSSSSSGGSDYGSSGGGGDMGCGGFACFMFVIIVAAVMAAVVKARKKGGGGPMYMPPQGRAVHGMGGYAPQPQMQVTALALGLDWRARKEIQAALSQMARSGMTGTAEGRATLLRETVLLLRRAELSWLYVGFRDLGVHSPQNAESAFRSLASEARSRYRAELVRAADGAMVADRPLAQAIEARPEEGPGVVVVTLVVASRRSLPGITDPRNAASIRAALEARGSVTAGELAAMEVIWSPAVENDRLSTAELEQHYPDMVKIDPASVAGRVFCEYCGGPFPMELLTCPHCRAPVQRH